MKKQNQNFSDAAILDIYQNAVFEWEQYKQWSNYPTQAHASHALIRLAKCEALVELLESITVFYHGGGYDKEINLTLFERLKSFESPMNELMKEINNAPN